MMSLGYESFGRFLLVLGMAIGLASPAGAVGSRNASRPPEPVQAQPNDYEQGVKAVKAREFARALTLLRKVVLAEPTNADAWNYIGYSHRSLKQFDQALAAYEKALRINPSHLGANEYLGELYLQTRDLEKARKQFAKLAGLCPSGCEERDDLGTAIKAYELADKANGAAARGVVQSR
jgi:tetratricopeptide (TPR) repeat protein